MSADGIDYGDVQGLIRFAHAHLPEACFFLLRVKDPAAARSWLAAAPVLDAVETDPRPSTALHVAFTRDGLAALGVPDHVVEGFSAEFISGMAGDPSRSRRLGDVGASSPSGWRWGGPGNEPHVLVMLYAAPGRLEPWKASLRDHLWTTAFETMQCLDTANLDGVEPFGFVDGISQPALDWARTRNGVAGNQLRYTNLSALGEFVLGYPNEYAKYTERPLLDAPGASLPAAEDARGKMDLGRNGTYLVLRELRQDVRGFWQFLDRQTNGDPARRRELAEAMVGRRMDGRPFLAASKEAIPGVGPDADDVGYNQFTYESDGDGTRCPIGSHIRRANPRNADFPDGTAGVLQQLLRTLGLGRKGLCDDLVASARFHRILRRGREYGPGLSVEEALHAAPADEPERGLYFIGLNANISRQFEFVQNAWLTGTKFAGLRDESDPLLGTREPLRGCPVTDGFSIPDARGVRRRISGLPQFVTVRGGAYFFLPGMRALRHLMTLGG
jgi:deferrochelatase/peroxidase EfeB